MYRSVTLKTTDEHGHTKYMPGLKIGNALARYAPIKLSLANAKRAAKEMLKDTFKPQEQNNDEQNNDETRGKQWLR